MGQIGGLSPGGSLAVGILVGLISTGLQAIGLTLQRKSHLREDEKYPYDMRRPPYKRRRWQVGMSLFILSNIVGSTVQLTTLPLPVLSTLQASGLVFNTVFATLILGEAFTRYSFIGTVLVCIGAVMIAMFGSVPEPAHTLDQLLALLARPAFIRWLATTAVIVGVTLLGTRILKIVSAPNRSKGWVMRKYRLPYTAPFHSPRLKAFRGMLYGSVSGVLSAHLLLLAKSAVELVVRTVMNHVNQFNRWQSWVIVVGVLVLAPTQLYYMHRGLKLCSTSVLYPFVFCVYNVVAILDGLIYFHQTSKLSVLHAALIALGTAILLAGVLCLSWRLEEFSSKTTAPAVGPPPAPLTPGMGLLDEQNSTEQGYTDDEESQQGERQPLLMHTPRARPSSSNRYTLPTITPIHKRTNTTPNTETAQVWAELEDEEEDGLIDSNVHSPSTPSSPLHRFHKRHTTKSRTMSSPSSSKNNGKAAQGSTSNGDQLSPLLPMNGHDKGGGRGTWGRRSSRFRPHNARSNSTSFWRRISAPAVTDLNSTPHGEVHRDVSSETATRPNNRSDADTTNRQRATSNYRDEPSSSHTDDNENERLLQDAEQHQEQQPSESNRVSDAWDAGRRWLRGWMNPGNNDTG